MIDANTHALNKYQDKIMKQEVSYEMFLSTIDDDLSEIQDIVRKLKKIASDYDGYDFTDELRELINDAI